MADGEAAPRGLARWAGVGGVLYAVLGIIGVILIFGGQPDTSSPPAKIIAYFGNGSHRNKINIGWLLIVIAVFFLVWFVAGVREVVLRVSGNQFLASVATIGGAAYAATTLAAFSIQAGIKTMSDDTYRHQVYPELIHAADDAGYVMHSAGGAAVGAMFVAASVAMLASRSFPKWLAWLGVLAGIVSIFAIVFFPWFVIIGWILVAGILMLVSSLRGGAPVNAVS